MGVDELKRNTRSAGPGGWKCHCCGPAAANKTVERRRARRRLKASDRGGHDGNLE